MHVELEAVYSTSKLPQKAIQDHQEHFHPQEHFHQPIKPSQDPETPLGRPRQRYPSVCTLTSLTLHLPRVVA
jgi:hypothetical protein